MKKLINLYVAFKQHRKIIKYAKEHVNTLRMSFNRHNTFDISVQIKNALKKYKYTLIEDFFMEIPLKAVAICVGEATDNPIIKSFLKCKFSDAHKSTIYSVRPEPPRNFITDEIFYSPHHAKMNISSRTLIDDWSRAFVAYRDEHKKIPTAFDDLFPYADHVLLIAKIFKETKNMEIKDKYMTLASDTHNVILASVLYKYGTQPEQIYLRILFGENLFAKYVFNIDGKPLDRDWIDQC